MSTRHSYEGLGFHGAVEAVTATSGNSDARNPSQLVSALPSLALTTPGKRPVLLALETSVGFEGLEVRHHSAAEFTVRWREDARNAGGAWLSARSVEGQGSERWIVTPRELVQTWSACRIRNLSDAVVLGGATLEELH